MWGLYELWTDILKIQKFRRTVSYAGFYCFTALISYAYCNNTTRAGYSRADQFYAAYPAGTELLVDTGKLYKAALANVYEEEEWGPIEWSILAKHFERQGNSAYSYHAIAPLGTPLSGIRALVVNELCLSLSMAFLHQLTNVVAVLVVTSISSIPFGNFFEIAIYGAFGLPWRTRWEWVEQNDRSDRDSRPQTFVELGCGLVQTKSGCITMLSKKSYVGYSSTFHWMEYCWK